MVIDTRRVKFRHSSLSGRGTKAELRGPQCV